MNARRWLAISLVANIGLAVALFSVLPRSHPTDPQTTDAAATKGANNPSLAKTDLAPTAPPPLDWTDSMARFRQAGVPSAILAKLVFEKIALKWAPLEQQFEEDYLNDRIDTKRLAELHDQRECEQDAELRRALGDGYEAWDRQFTVDNMYLGGLQPTGAQREALYPLQKDYLRRTQDLDLAKQTGRMDEPTFNAAHEQLEGEYKHKLAAIIGEDRVDGLRGHDDPVADVRREFIHVPLTDAQIQELVAVQQKWRDIEKTMSQSVEETKTVDPADERDLRAVDRAREAEVRRILGPETFELWQKNRGRP